MNQPFKWFGSVAWTNLLTVTFCHLMAILISHLKSIFIFKITLNISIQCFMFKILCICNWIKHSMSLRVALNSVNTSKCHFRCNFCRDVCWWYWFYLFGSSLNVYYLNWLIKCNNLTQKMHTFRKKIAWLKGKTLFKLKWKDELNRWCERTTQNMKNIKHCICPL